MTVVMVSDILGFVFLVMMIAGGITCGIILVDSKLVDSKLVDSKQEIKRDTGIWAALVVFAVGVLGLVLLGGPYTIVCDICK